MLNSVRDEITVTDNNLFVQLVLSKTLTNEEKENEEILCGSSKNHIPDEAKKIWNGLAPKHFMACPCDPPSSGFYINKNWNTSENKFDSLEKAKADLKKHIDAIEHLPFLFLSACGVSVHPQVEFFLQHTYRGVHEWLMYFCLGTETPKSIVNFDGSIEINQEDKVVGKTVKLPDGFTCFFTTRDIEFFLDKSQSQGSITRYLAKHSIVTNKPIFLFENRDKEYLSNALLAENISKRFQPYYELIIELQKKDFKTFKWAQGLSVGELIFGCWIEFVYQQIIDLGIFSTPKIIKNELSKKLGAASKMFLEPNKCQFVVKDPVEFGFLQAINLSASYVGRQNLYYSKRKRNGQSSAIYKAGQAFRHQARQAKEPEFNHPFVHRGRVIVQKDKTRGLLRIVKDLTQNCMVREPLPFQKIQK